MCLEAESSISWFSKTRCSLENCTCTWVFHDCCVDNAVSLNVVFLTLWDQWWPLSCVALAVILVRFWIFASIALWSWTSFYGYIFRNWLKDSRMSSFTPCSSHFLKNLLQMNPSSDFLCNRLYIFLHIKASVNILFVRLGSYQSYFLYYMFVLLNDLPLISSPLLDSAFPTPSLFLSLGVRCLLFIYLYVYVFSNFFLKILSQPTVFDRFLSYYTRIISRKFCFWFVVGVAVWQILAIWWQLTFFIKNGLGYSEKQINCDVTIVLFLNTVLGVGEWGTWN